MFKSLREKLTSWFKKPEVEEKKAVEIIEKKGKAEKKTKKEVKLKKETALKKGKKEERTEESKVEEKLKVKEESIIEAAPTEEIKEEVRTEEKQGFFKKLFSKKKKEEFQETSIEPISEIKQEQIPEQQSFVEKTEKKEGFFAKLASKLSTSTLTQGQFDELFQELEMALLENNVALQVVDKIHDELSRDLVGIEVKKSKVQETIINSLKETILSILIEPPNLIESIKKKLKGPYVIIFVGINGSGKTTSIAKLASYLKQNNISCVLAAADTFRAASIEQLEKHAESLEIPIIKHQYGSDPAAVTFDAKKYAETHKINVVLIDTAGRMYTKTNLIKEMEKIVRVSQPDLKIFVAESITGNDATEQAKTFNESINIDGIILSKADIDEKAGTILSVSYITKKPIYFLGTGQKYSDLTPFTKQTILKNLGLE